MSWLTAKREFTNLMAVSANQEIASCDESRTPVAGLERAITGDQPLRGVSLCCSFAELASAASKRRTERRVTTTSHGCEPLA
jgi:hypothetical protein